MRKIFINNSFDLTEDYRLKTLDDRLFLIDDIMSMPEIG